MVFFFYSVDNSESERHATHEHYQNRKPRVLLQQLHSAGRPYVHYDIWQLQWVYIYIYRPFLGVIGAKRKNVFKPFKTMITVSNSSNSSIVFASAE